MRIIRASYEIESLGDPDSALALIEKAGRKCYRSEGKAGPGTAPGFVSKRMSAGHLALVEFGWMAVSFTVNRGASHEFVRQRLASFAQESTRYCDYNSEKFGGELTFVEPCWFHEPGRKWNRNAAVLWLEYMESAERAYLDARGIGFRPEEARDLLPHALRAEMMVAANFREWGWIFHLRTAHDAHPQMREVMKPLLRECRRRMPVIFDTVGNVEPEPWEEVDWEGGVGGCL